MKIDTKKLAERIDEFGVASTSFGDKLLLVGSVTFFLNIDQSLEAYCHNVRFVLYKPISEFTVEAGDIFAYLNYREMWRTKCAFEAVNVACHDLEVAL